MYSGKRQKFDWVFVLYVVDAVAIVLAILGAPSVASWLNLSDDAIGVHNDTWGHALVYLLCLLNILERFNIYAWSTFMSARKMAWLLFQAVFLNALLISGFLLLAQYNLKGGSIYWWITFQSFVTFALMALGRLLAWFAMVRLFNLIPQERIAFVGWSLKMERVIRSLQREMHQFQSVLGYLEPGKDESQTLRESGFVRLGSITDLEAIQEAEQITLLIIDEGALTGDQLKALGADCSRLMINFRLIPSAFDILGRRLVTRVMAGVPVMGIQGVPMDLYHNRLAKRCVDILGALVGLTLSAPIIIICGTLIRMESPGSIFYLQERLGQHGHSFHIVKLRSMRPDAEKGGPGWTVKDDPRRLKIGTFLRKWNLDEVPQFWNVLVGDMSLVGPRPERPEYVEQFMFDFRHYNLRHYCKPGMTSWAAVHGLRGNTSLVDRLDYDLYYLENWNLVLDFQIMIMTLMPPRNAY